MNATITVGRLARNPSTWLVKILGYFGGHNKIAYFLISYQPFTDPVIMHITLCTLPAVIITIDVSAAYSCHAALDESYFAAVERSASLH
jgi:hypothetical protein